MILEGDTNMTLGEKIKNIRTNLKLTQAEFANELYYSHHTVSKWELGINIPTYSDIELICSTYNIPLSEMLDIPVLLKENPYYEAILSTLYEFQLVSSTKELVNEIADKMVTYSINIDSIGKEKIVNIICINLDELEKMGHIKRTKTENFDVIQMTHKGLSSAKAILSVNRECEEFWFGTYLYENKDALTIYEELKKNISCHTKNPVMYQSELDEINEFISTRERIIEMIFGLYDNVKPNFDIGKTVIWNMRKTKLLNLNPNIESRPIISMMLSNIKEHKEENNFDVRNSI